FYIQAGTTLCLALLAAISLSKAAILSFGLLMCLHFTKNPKLLVVIVALSLPIVALTSASGLADRVSERIEAIGQQTDDSAAGRGYNRIIDYPQYLILGAAEGGYDRFVNIHLELHSTLGTIFFSYGIVGSCLFLLCMWRLYRQAGLRQVLY